MKNQWLLIGSCLLTLGALSGCSQDHEGNLALKRMEVHQEQYGEQFTSHDLTPQIINRIAADYQRNGNNGPISLMVQYDPASSQNTAMNATNHAVKIAKSLREAGVKDISTEIMPVNDVGDHSKTLVTYDRFSAHAPTGCDGMMPGLDNTRTDWKAVKDYQFGCSVETTIAKQIARPKDLLGTDGFDGVSDGRRASNIIDQYRTGIPNEKLEGQRATEE